MKRSSCGMAEPNPTAAPARPQSPLSGQAPLKRQRPLLPVLPSHSNFAAPLSVRSQLGLDLTHRPDCPKRTVFAAAAAPTLSSFDLAGIVQYIKRNQCKNIIVMTGAGVSVSAGIPDFRSPGTGLYHNLQKYNLPTPESVFALDYFHMNPRPFCMLAKELYPGNFQPTPAHHFVKLLHDQGLLLRNYTQNIDGLERLAGVPPEKLVEAHGTFATARCLGCGKMHDAESVRTMLFRNEIPRCDALTAMTPSPASKASAKSLGLPFTSPSPLSGASTSFTASSPSPVIFSDSSSLLDGLDDAWNVLPSSSDDSLFAAPAPAPPCSGLVKPDIVFFGESLPHRFFALAEMDFPRCDLLIVMGTSLEVHPFAGLVHRVRSHVPRLLVNLNPVGQAPTVRIQFVDKGLWTPELSSDSSSGDDSSNCGCDLDDCDESSSTADSASAISAPSARPSPSPSLPARTPSAAVSEVDSSRSVSPSAATEEVKHGSSNNNSSGSSSDSESDNDSEDEELVEDGRPHAYFFRRSNGVDVYIERGSENDPETLQLLADIRADSRLGLRFHLADNTRDVFAQGTCDAGVKQLAALLGWQDRLERAIASAAPVRSRTE